MAVVIETDIWEPNQAVFIFIFISCFFSIFCLPHFTTSIRTSTVFDQSSSPLFLRFQRSFLLIFSISSVMEGLWSAFGEFELMYYGVSREQKVLSFSVGFAAALFLGSFLGILSDLIGQKKFCLAFCGLHLFVGIWKRITPSPSLWLASICLSLASSIFSFSFETWIVNEHHKLGQRQDALNDMFWLMTFIESVSMVVSQMLANSLSGFNLEKTVVSPSTATVILAIMCFFLITRNWKESTPVTTFNEYRTSFNAYVFGDKRIWLLSWAQTCLHFSISVFWILWAPTIVADGREVHLGLIYPCLLGSRMFGSAAYPWFVNGPLSLRTEDCLVYLFSLSAILLSIVAYDYQEIGFLVVLFCLFHACIGLILPSLARLRTMYVPNELRGGMISLSLAPANAAVLLFLIQGGLYKNVDNSTIIAFAAIGLLSAAACMHLLKTSGKQPGHNWHKS